jgi:hypothetical protein
MFRFISQSLFKLQLCRVSVLFAYDISSANTASYRFTSREWVGLVVCASPSNSSPSREGAFTL